MCRPSILATLLLPFAIAVHAEVINIDNAELARLSASGAAVIDIRTAPEWTETGVIAGPIRSSPLAWAIEVADQARPTRCPDLSQR